MNIYSDNFEVFSLDEYLLIGPFLTLRGKKDFRQKLFNNKFQFQSIRLADYLSFILELIINALLGNV